MLVGGRDFDKMTGGDGTDGWMARTFSLAPPHRLSSVRLIGRDLSHGGLSSIDDVDNPLALARCEEILQQFIADPNLDLNSIEEFCDDGVADHHNNGGGNDVFLRGTCSATEFWCNPTSLLEKIPVSWLGDGRGCR